MSGENPDISAIPNAVMMADFKSSQDGLEIDFAQLPFDHPLYVMYSSGTTGLPKCMVQSAGGILIHHLKELMLHTDLKRDGHDFLLYHLRVDDVELAGQQPGHRRHPGAV
jgi:acetoacetyl-CoA synthetase